MSSNNVSVYFGVATEDRIESDTKLKVYSPEINPFVSGPLADVSNTEKGKVIDDITGNEEEIEVTTTNSITAEYFSIVPYIQSTPYIKQGERVILFHYRDDDKYYWIPLNRDFRLHTPEILRIAVSNDPDGGNLKNDTNTYFLEIDTKYNKHIKLKTSQSNEEEFEYAVSIDTKRNQIRISDNDGRSIILNSTKDSITMRNKKKSVLSMIKGNILLTAENIHINADDKISMVAGNDVSIVTDDTWISTHDQGSSFQLNGDKIASIIGEASITATASDITDDVSGNTIVTDGSNIITTVGGGKVDVSTAAVNIGAPAINLTSATMSMSSGGDSGKNTISGEGIVFATSGGLVVQDATIFTKLVKFSAGTSGATCEQ